MAIQSIMVLSGNSLASSMARGIPASMTKTGTRLMYMNSTDEAPKCPCTCELSYPVAFNAFWKGMINRYRPVIFSNSPFLRDMRLFFYLHRDIHSRPHVFQLIRGSRKVNAYRNALGDLHEIAGGIVRRHHGKARARSRRQVTDLSFERT